jgi:tetratricopeptide (TPR) repeat protein
VERRRVRCLGRSLKGLCLFYEWRVRYEEGEAACRRAVERLAAGDKEGLIPSKDEVWRLVARILTWQGAFAQLQYRIEAARELLERGLDLLEGPQLAGHDTRAERASLLFQMGRTLLDTDREESRRCCLESASLFRAVGDRWGRARALYRAGQAARIRGDHAEGQRDAQKSLALFRELGDRRGIFYSLSGLALGLDNVGRTWEALQLHRETVALCRELGNPGEVAHRLLGLGWYLMNLGKLSEARSVMEEGLAIYEDLNVRRMVAHQSLNLAAAMGYQGLYGEAELHGRRALDLARELGYLRTIGSACNLLGFLALADSDHQEARRWHREGITVLGKIGDKDLMGLGYAGLGLGELGKARRHFRASLRIVAETGHVLPRRFALTGMARLFAEQGQAERAVELYALAACDPLVAKAQSFEDIAGRHVREAAGALPADVVAAARARGRGRDPQATVRELLEELEREIEAGRGVGAERE